MPFHHVAAAALAVAVSIPHCQAQEAPSEVVVAEAFGLAMADLSAGNPELAIPLLRGILARDPELDRVRLELARAYFEAGQFGPAREQFRIVLSSPDLPEGVRKNILRFLQRTDEERELRTNFGFALVAPSGSGRRYDSDTILLDIFGAPLLFELNRPEVPEVAIRFEGNVRKQWALGDSISGAQGSTYIRGRTAFEEAEGVAFDKREVDVGTGVTLTWPRHTVSAELYASGLGISDELKEARVGTGLTYEARTASGRSYFASGNTAHLEDLENDAGSGTVAKFRMGLAQSIASTGSFSFAVGAEVRNAEREDFGYSSVDVLLAHKVDLEGGVSLTGSLHFELFEQEAPTPGFLEERVETEKGISLRAEKNDLFIANRYTPYFQIGFSRRDSSISAFSYEETRLEAGISSAF